MTLFRYALALLTLAVFGAAAADPYAAVRDKLVTCTACHGENGAAPIQPSYPILAGQHFYYTYVQLKDLKSGLRKNAVMNPIAAELEKSEMKLIAQYFAEQSWPAGGYRAVREIARAKQHVRSCWPDLRIAEVRMNGLEEDLIQAGVLHMGPDGDRISGLPVSGQYVVRGLEGADLHLSDRGHGIPVDV